MAPRVYADLKLVKTGFAPTASKGDHAMKLILGSAALAAAAFASACAPAAETLTLAGKWEGEITCYSMASPLSMTVDPATPEKASLAMGAEGALTWDASVAIDPATRTATITSAPATGDAAIITGPLSADGKTLSGEMARQLCNKFTLTRAS
jgi:hypothetical protein